MHVWYFSMHGKGSSCCSVRNSTASSIANGVRLILMSFYFCTYFACFGALFNFDISYLLLLEHIWCSVFNHLLDDNPLPANEASSSVLVATYSPLSWPCSKGDVGGGRPPLNGEVEKGLLTLICSDSPGLQVSFSIATLYILCILKRTNNAIHKIMFFFFFNHKYCSLSLVMPINRNGFRIWDVMKILILKSYFAVVFFHRFVIPIIGGT